MKEAMHARKCFIVKPDTFLKVDVYLPYFCFSYASFNNLRTTSTMFKLFKINLKLPLGILLATLGLVTTSNANLIFYDDFSSADTSEGPVGLDGRIIPGTSSSLQWAGDPRFEIVEFGSPVTKSVLNPVATEGNGSGPITVRQSSDINQGILVSEFELSFDAYYFSTVSNGGNNWAGVNYFVDSVQFVRNVSTGGDTGFKMEYRMRNDGNSFDYRLLMNDGAGVETVNGSEGTLTIADSLINNSSSVIPGAPVSVSISVLDGVHSLSVGGSEVYSLSISTSLDEGYFNFIPTNNRDNGFSNVSLTQIPEPGHIALILGFISLCGIILKRKIR